MKYDLGRIYFKTPLDFWVEGNTDTEIGYFEEKVLEIVSEADKDEAAFSFHADSLNADVTLMFRIYKYLAEEDKGFVVDLYLDAPEGYDEIEIGELLEKDDSFEKALNDSSDQYVDALNKLYEESSFRIPGSGLVKIDADGFYLFADWDADLKCDNRDFLSLQITEVDTKDALYY